MKCSVLLEDIVAAVLSMLILGYIAWTKVGFFILLGVSVEFLFNEVPCL